MGAPSDTTWGGVITKSQHEGRIGISRTWEDKGTYEHAVVKVWFWSKYKLSDVNNLYYYGKDSVPTYQGAVSINHTSNDAWSTANQTLMGTYTYDFTKQKSDYVVNFQANFSGIDVLGSDNTMRASRNYTVYALTSYSVSYNANGGTNAPSNQTKW